MGSNSGGGGGGFGSLMSLFSIGFWIYNLFNPNKAPKPKPQELSINNYNRNMPVPICYGTCKYDGTVIYIGNNEIKIIGQGIKGGGSEQIQYFCEFAVGFSEGLIYDFLDIIYNGDHINVDSDYYSKFKLYLGEENQEINEGMQNFLKDKTEPAISLKNTAYIYVNGDLGYSNDIPVLSSVVSGKFSYTGQSVSDEWTQIGDRIDGIWMNHTPIVLDDGTLKWAAFDASTPKKLRCYSFNFDNNTYNVDYEWTLQEAGSQPGQYVDLVIIGTPLLNIKNQLGLLVRRSYYVGVWYYYIDKYYFDFKNGSMTIYSGAPEVQKTIGGQLIGYDRFSMYWYTQYGRIYHMFLFESGYSIYDYIQLSDYGIDHPSFLGSNYNENAPYYWYGCSINQYDFSIFTAGQLPDAITDYSFFSYRKSSDLKWYICRCSMGEYDFMNEIQMPFRPHSIIPFEKFPQSCLITTAGSDLLLDTFKIYKLSLEDHTLELMVSMNIAPSYGLPLHVDMQRVDDYVFIKLQTLNPGGASPDTYPNFFYRWKIGSDVVQPFNPQPPTSIYWGFDEFKCIEGKMVVGNCYQNTDGVSHFKYFSTDLFSGSQYDANPIEVLYDLLTNKRYGMGIDPNFIDGSPYTSGSWKEEYDYCFQLVTMENNKKECRFLYSNVFLNKSKGYDLINDILQTCRGYIYYCNGKLKVGIQKNNETPVLYFGYHVENFVSNLNGTKIRIYADFSNYPTGYWNGDIGIFGENNEHFIILNQTSTYLDLVEEISINFPENGYFTVTKDNIIKGSFQWKEKKQTEKFNRIKLEYIDRDGKTVNEIDKETNEVIPYLKDSVETSNEYDIELTDEIRDQSFSMLGIKRNTQARRMVQFLYDYNEMVNFQCSFDTDILGVLLCIGDIIGITYQPLDWFGKLFRVISMDELQDYETKLELVEYIPEIYHDYYAPIIKTDNYSFGNKYEIPDQVERFGIYEDYITNSLYFYFKKPDNNFWAGAVLYDYTNGEFNKIQTIFCDIPSVKLNSSILSTDTTIYFDSNTLYGTLPSSGSFFIESEEIFYNDIDDDNNCFLNCIRGYNESVSANHDVSQYCNIHSSSVFVYKYLDSDIGKTFKFKAVSVSIYNVSADVLLAPEATITIFGYSFLPYQVGLLKAFIN